MRDEIRRVKSYSIEIRDGPGEAFNTLSRLEEAGINLTFFVAHPLGNGTARVAIMVDDPRKLVQIVEQQKIARGTWVDAFMISGPDRAGRAAEVLRHLAEAHINVEGASGTARGGSYGMILWVRPEDVDAAARALRI